MSRLIVFTGSPSSESLEWNEEHLENGLLPAFDEKQYSYIAADETQFFPVWRSLPLKASHLPTGMTQVSEQEVPIDSFPRGFVRNVVTESVTGRSNDAQSALEDTRHLETETSASPSQIRTQYYEHSFDVHEELQ